MAKNTGTLVISAIRPNDSQDRIATAYSSEIMGGLHAVEDLASRDSIIVERRDWGMMCYAKDENKTYQLTFGHSSEDITDNNNWIEFSGAGGTSEGTTEWRDSVISILDSPPLLYSVGDRFLGGTGPASILSGDWVGVTGGVIIERDTASTWNYIEPSEGWNVRVDNEKNVIYRYSGEYPTGNWEKERLNQVLNVSADSVDGLSFTGISSNAFDSYQEDIIFLTSFGTASAGTSTLNIDGLGDRPLRKGGPNGLRELSPNDILPDLVYNVVYDGQNFQIIRNYSKEDLFSIKYYIEPTDFITVPQYHQYWVYGDLTIEGHLVNYGQVIIANGSMNVLGGTFSNYGDLMFVNFNSGLSSSYVDSDTIEFDVSTSPYTVVSANVKEESLTPNLLNTDVYGGATSGYILSNDGNVFKWVPPGEAGVGGAISVSDYSSGETINNVQNIIFRGGAISIPGGTSSGVRAEGISPTVTVWIPAPEYVSNFNPALYSVPYQRYISTPDINSYTPSVSKGNYGVGDWDTVTDFSSNITRGVTNESIITAFSDIEFSCLDLTTTFDFYLLDEIGATISSIESYPITSNSTTQSGGLTITLTNFSSDKDRYKANVTGTIDLATAMPNGGRFNYKIVHNNSTDGTYEFQLPTDIFYDSPASQATLPTAAIDGSVSIEEDTNILTYYSGVAFYKIGSKISVDVSNINYLNEITIPTTKQITISGVNIPFSSTNDGYADGSKGTGGAIDGWSLLWDKNGLTYSVVTTINTTSVYKPGFSSNNTISSTGISYVKARVFDYGEADQKDSPARAMLYDTVTPTAPTYNYNALNSELGRLSFDDILIDGSATFDSTVPLNLNDLQYIFGRVIYPQTDFTAFYPSDNSSALIDYSSLGGSSNSFIIYENTNGVGTTSSVNFSGYRWHVTSYGANSAYSTSFTNGIFTLNSNFVEADLHYDGNVLGAGTGDLVLLLGIDTSSNNTTPDRFIFMSGDYTTYSGRTDALNYNLQKPESSKNIKFSLGTLDPVVKKVWLFVGYKDSVRGKQLRLSSISFTI